jgi:hypothetical protein
MGLIRFYTLGEAKEITGEDRGLITYLIRDRQIPTVRIGMAKVLDRDGLRLLEGAIAEYRAKPEPASTS